MKPISDLTELLRSMQPVLNDGAYYFVTLPENCDLPLIATIREREGLSVVISEEIALAHAWLAKRFPRGMDYAECVFGFGGGGLDGGICQSVGASRH